MAPETIHISRSASDTLNEPLPAGQQRGWAERMQEADAVKESKREELIEANTPPTLPISITLSL